MPEAAPAPQRLSHITFVVADLDRMDAVLTGVFGARKVYDSGSTTFSLFEERFFLLGQSDIWIAVMKGTPRLERSYDHFAFQIEAADLDLYRDRILSLGLELREGRSRVQGEGQSLYFHDHDNHLFELHTGTLAERLARYAAGLRPEPGAGEANP